ncbi:hypothetical protein PG994_000434 [Apiospora phragmitis]|uniref:RidA family protein n=1 Tax=Apiospora phragmitis TaxID=2905665 RepID=A0ABR1X6D9_9PEZI
MERTLVSSGSSFEAQIGYSRAVVTGEWVFVSGCTGYDYKSGTISPDPAEQAEQCLKNIAAALAEAGATMDEIVRVRYIFPDRADFPKCWDVLQRYFGGHHDRRGAHGGGHEGGD